MPKRSSKASSPEDVNETAFRVLQEATGEPMPEREKNPAAVALGRLGGKKGGAARAAKLCTKARAPRYTPLATIVGLDGAVLRNVMIDLGSGTMRGEIVAGRSVRRFWAPLADAPTIVHPTHPATLK